MRTSLLPFVSAMVTSVFLVVRFSFLDSARDIYRETRNQKRVTPHIDAFAKKDRIFELNPKSPGRVRASCPRCAYKIVPIATEYSGPARSAGLFDMGAGSPTRDRFRSVCSAIAAILARSAPPPVRT